MDSATARSHYTAPPGASVTILTKHRRRGGNPLFLSRRFIVLIGRPDRRVRVSRHAMDFDQLHTFLEIVRLKSFSKAAQTCYRTQPAISAQVRQLEQELRTELFERFGSRISLTTAGQDLRRLRRADAGPAPPRAGRHRRAGDQSARRTGDRRQRSHLHLRAAQGLLRIPPALPGGAVAGGPLLRLARGGSRDGQFGGFRPDPTAGGRKAPAGGQHPPRRDPPDRARAPSAGRTERGHARRTWWTISCCSPSRARRAPA